MHASPQVRRINTDARAFLNESTERYDLIIFGTLDSMTRLSALSNVRLDNFVYTTECIEAAKAHLTTDGGLVMYFMVSTDYIDQRLAGMAAQVFGIPPVVVNDYRYLFNRIYLSGPAFAHVGAAERRAQMDDTRRLLSMIELPSDDWPYLYLRERSLDSFYVFLIGVIALLAISAVAFVSEEMRHSLSVRSIDGEMFFFGLAFLLLETKSVTTMSLLWGATWLTSAVVFGAILAMVLVATVLMQLRPLRWSWCMTGLVVSLLIAYAVPVHTMLRVNELAKLAISVLFVGTPIFFAAACFALIFRDREEADVAFGWNLLGAVVGGLVEFLSMMTGMRALYLLAVTAYLAATLVRLRAAEPAQEVQPAVASPV